MTQRALISLKSQDLVVLLRIHLLAHRAWTYASLATELGMSASEVHAGCHRARVAQLYNPVARCLRRENLLEFLLHGLRYAFPVHLGESAQGVETGLASTLWGSADPWGGAVRYVWPHPSGEARGQAVVPLHPRLPEVAPREPELHRAVALLDALRAGRSAERRVAADLLLRHTFAEGR